MNLLVRTILISAIFSQSLFAGVYKWTDENGRVHFSDRPVSESSTEVKIKKAPSSDTSNSSSQQRQQKMRKMLDAFEEERNEKKEAKQKAKKEREKRKKKCIYAKDRYNSHNRASGIYSYKKDGQKNYLSDADRKTHMQRLKAEVDRWCK
jgi:vacuolar-type H+-ATPase subunit I/STV1